MYTKKAHTIIWVSAAFAMAVAAVIYNPAHLFTATIILAFALGCPLQEEDERK